MTENNRITAPEEAPFVDLDFVDTPEQNYDGDRPPIAVLCGSTRFRKEIEDANHDLTLQGYIVLAPGVFHHTDEQHLDDEDKAALDRLHLRKIDMADVVMVVNPGGYIGHSTTTEIAYSNSLSKPVLYTDAPAENV